MSKIIVTPEEFANFVVSFLLDKISHKDKVLPDYDEFSDIVWRMEKGGIKPHLMKMYLHMDALNRGKYKRIKEAFSGDTHNTYEILISSDKSTKEKSKKTDKYKVKDLIKKAIRLIKQERQRTGFPLNEDKLDRIIEHVINQQKEWEEK